MRSQLSEDFKSLKLNGSLKRSDSFNCWREQIRYDKNRLLKKNCDELPEIKTILISVNLRPCKVINIISPHYPSLSVYLYPNSTLHKQQPATLTDKSIGIATLCIASERHLRLWRAHDYTRARIKGKSFCKQVVIASSLIQAGLIPSQMFSGYYDCKIMVVIACSLIQAGLIPSQIFSGYYDCKISLVP